MTDIVERLRHVMQNTRPLPLELIEEAAAEIDRLRAELHDHKAALDRAGRQGCGWRDEIERLRAALERIETWSRAYPLAVFPEPDFKRAAELLKAGGMTLDALSASTMRHVVEGVGKIARDALTGK